MSIFIKNGKVISMDEGRDKIVSANIFIEGDTIKYIDGDEHEADTIIDASGKYIIPGLINCHTHLAMSIFRESCEGYDLISWLENKMWPAEAKLTEDDVYYGTVASCIEMIKSGTTTSNDDYFLENGIIRAIKDCKVRNVTTRFLMDSDGKGKERIEEFEKYYTKNKDNELVTFSIAPHSLYTCSKEYLKQCEQLATKYNLPIHIHFSENDAEVNSIINKTNMLPGEYIKDLGLTNHPLILAHGVKVEKKEYGILKDINGGVVHNPVSNLRLGCGIANISEYIENGILVALGTDGQGSCGNMDMFRTMGYAALLQKGLNKDPKSIDSYEVLELATVNGAKMLQLENKIGMIKEGLKADILILSLDKIELSPTRDPVSQIVYNGTGDMVTTTIVNGNILMKDKKLMLDNIDEENIKIKIEEIANRIIN